MLIKQVLASRSEPDNNGCMNWLRGKCGKGYGAVYFAKKLQKAHRVVWEYFNGEIPDGMFVCHACDNRACCNPKHLFVGTQADNMRDKVMKGRQPRGVEIPWTKLKDGDVLTIRSKYAQGQSAAAIARDYGMVHTSIGKIITGMTWGHLPGAIKKLRPRKIEQSVVDEMIRLFKKGGKPKDIAAKLNQSESTVYHIATGRRHA